MTEILRWWRNKSREERKEIMKDRNIKAITYREIKVIYNETKL